MADDSGIPGHFPHQLAQWWEHGEGAAKIRWGSPGDFDRCVRLAVSEAHMSPGQAKGFCNERHHAVLGIWPATHAKQLGRSAGMAQGDYDADGLDSSWDGDHSDLPDLTGLHVQHFEAAEKDAGMAPAAAGRAASRPGTGARFRALSASLAAKGAHDPKALAAWIGRRKYGKAAFHKLAAAARRGGGRSMELGADASGGRSTERVPVERRYSASPVECRASEDGQRIGGYAAVFHTRANPVISRNLGGFVERVMPSAFNQARHSGFPGAVCRYNHDANMLLGTIAGHTLTLDVQAMGLRYDVLPPQSRADILELVARGDVQHSSFAFRVPEGGDEWALSEQNYPLRSLLDVQLVDVAPVVDPAYPDATAGLRSLAERFGADPEEVRSMAENDELRKFFALTGTAPAPRKPERKRMLGAAAQTRLLERRFDPWIDEG